MAIKGYWRLNGNSNDASGNGNNGTDTNITYSQANGRLGQGAGFNGTSSKIQGYSNLGIQGGTVTISCWIYLTTNAQTVFSVVDATTHVGYYIYTSSGASFKYSFARVRKAIAVDAANSDISLIYNAWQHLVLVYNSANSTMYGYRNSILIAQKTMSGNGTGTQSNLWVIGSEEGVGGFFGGKIDEVIVDNIAWSEAKIKNEYARVKGFF